MKFTEGLGTSSRPNLGTFAHTLKFCQGLLTPHWTGGETLKTLPARESALPWRVWWRVWWEEGKLW